MSEKCPETLETQHRRMTMTYLVGNCGVAGSLDGAQANVSSIKLDSFYVLIKDTNGVKAKFIGAPWMSSKKKVIWVPKSLVTNL